MFKKNNEFTELYIFIIDYFAEKKIVSWIVPQKMFSCSIGLVHFKKCKQPL